MEYKLNNHTSEKQHRVRYHEKCKGKTRPEFKDECDINLTMAKYVKTGQLPTLIKTNPQYGDFSSGCDYQEAHNLVLRAQEQFMSLDARVREKFANSPKLFLDWANNPANAEEMAKLGLIKTEAVERVANAKKSKSETKSESTGEKK